MKKTLIALTLASLSVAAVADVTIYGNIRAGVYNYSGKAHNGTRHSVTGIDDVGSYIGFKGNEDVAGGLKAIWQVESGIYNSGADQTGGSWAGRDSFIGLEGGFGKVRIGKMKGQFGSNMGGVDQWEYEDPTDGQSKAAHGLSVFTRTDARYSNAIRYDSPEWSGFSFNLLHGVDEYKRLNHVNTYGGERGSRHTTVLGLNYENAGWFAQYGFGLYADSYLKNDKLKDGQAHRLEVGYNANNLFVDLGWQYTKGFPADRNQVGTAGSLGNPTATPPVPPVAPGGLAAIDPDGAGYKGHELALSAAYTFGALTPKFTYAHGFKQKNNTDGKKIENSDYNQFILGLDYAMSKRTTAMISAGYGKGISSFGNSDKKETNYTYGVGVRHLF